MRQCYVRAAPRNRATRTVYPDSFCGAACAGGPLLERDVEDRAATARADRVAASAVDGGAVELPTSQAQAGHRMGAVGLAGAQALERFDGIVGRAGRHFVDGAAAGNRRRLVRARTVAAD